MKGASGSGVQAPACQPASPAEAIAAMIANSSPVAQETIPLELTAGRILAVPLRTDRESPACDVSAMDGYAVRLADLGKGRLMIAGDVLIGREPPSLPYSATLRIVTGAPVPPGAEAVLRREDVEEHAGYIDVSQDRARATSSGANIRRRGENAPAGKEIVQAGRVVGPSLVAALAAFGCSSARVYRKVRIGIMTTGDEVLPPEAVPDVWQLRNSNGPALQNLLSAPWLLPSRPHHAMDDPLAMRQAIESALEQNDALFLTGGVSMGVRDFVPAVLRDLGAEILFHRLPQRPGKPMLGALSKAGQPIFGLPGNPISVLTTARRIGVPVLHHLAGFQDQPQPQLVHVDTLDDTRLHLWWHRPARVTAPGRVSIVVTAGSGDVAGTAMSDGFVEIAPDQAAAQPVPFYPWTS